MGSKLWEHGWLLIQPVLSQQEWQKALESVKADNNHPWDSFRYYLDVRAFSIGIPQRLRVVMMTNHGTIIAAHSEIRDLGTEPECGLSISGLSNTVVSEYFRHKGIYTELIKLRNLIINCSQFDCVAARVKLGYEERYMAQYPGFRIVKDQDPHGAAWILRETRGKALDSDECASVVSYLEREVKKW